MDGKEPQAYAGHSSQMSEAYLSQLQANNITNMCSDKCLSNLAIRINMESLPRRPIYTVAAQEMLLCAMMQIGRSGLKSINVPHSWLKEVDRNRVRHIHAIIQVMLTRTMFAELACNS